MNTSHIGLNMKTPKGLAYIYKAQASRKGVAVSFLGFFIAILLIFSSAGCSLGITNSGTTDLGVTTPGGALADGVVQESYGPVSIAASGGIQPYRWAVADGALPAGLALDADTGVISGTPSNIETKQFTLRVSDAGSNSASINVSITIHSQFMTVKDGDFYYRGKPWFPYGVNYCPEYGVNPPEGSGYTQADSNYWLASRYYRSEAVEEDLAKMESLGINCIEFQASYSADTWPAMMDLIARCKQHKIMVNLAFVDASAVRPAYDGIDPIHVMDQIIPELSLANNSTIFAYNIVWEPHLGSWSKHGAWGDGLRAAYDGVWTRFLAREYGSIGEAESALGKSVSEPRTGGQPTSYQASGLVSYKLPVKAIIGNTYNCTVAVRNMGEATWKKDVHFLGVVTGVPSVQSRITVPGDVKSGEDAIFNFVYTPPNTVERQKLRFAMIEPGPGWFGAYFDWEVEVAATGKGVETEINAPKPALGPVDEDLTKPAPEPGVSVFRRCMDIETSKEFGRVADRVRQMDPNHLLSGHMGRGGNGNAAMVPSYPLDLYSFGSHFDFLGPENYEFKDILDPNELAARMAAIESYCRWASNGKPVMWGEAGYNPLETENPTTEYLQEQGTYYDNFITGLIPSLCNGVEFWWWAGGLRYNSDRSVDWGITNKDGTFRPAALKMRERAALATSPRPILANSLTREVNLMWYPQGFASIYAQFKEDAKTAIMAGQKFVFIGDGEGARSDETPQMFAGLPKHLWAEMAKVELKTGDYGAWFEVRDGLAYAVPKNTPIYVRASVVNLGDTKWMPRSSVNKGGVAFAANEKFGIGFRYFLTGEVPRIGAVEIPAVMMKSGIAEDTDVQFQMLAENVSWITGSIRIKLVVEQ